MNCDVLGQSSLTNKNTYPQIKDQIVIDIKVSPINKFYLKPYKYIADISLNIYFITCKYGTKGRKKYNKQSMYALNSYYEHEVHN